ncbi:MAG: hypothetical protein K2O52_04565 [Oscillospiraceae bacterium]|nr:hypothetical protein [Oscillospiraceae bacterium]
MNYENLIEEVVKQSGVNQEVVKNILSICERIFEGAIFEEKNVRSEIKIEEVIKVTLFPKGTDFYYTKFWTKEGKFIGTQYGKIG